MKPIIRLLLSIVLALFASTNCQAQTDTIKQYTNNNGPCDKKEALYYRIAVKVDSIWYCNEYYLNGLTIKSEGQYTDANLTKKVGKFVDYYFSGNVRAVRHYLDNKKNDLEMKYARNSRLTDSTLYLDDNPTEYSYGWYDNGRIRKLGVYSRDGRSTGKETEYYEDSSVSSFGIFSEGHKKDSIWTYFFHNGVVSYREYFNKGVLTKKECYNEKGNASNKCDSSLKPEPGYKWEQYLGNAVRFPKEEDYQRPRAGRVLVIFRIYEDGSIHDAEVIQKLYPSLDKAALDVVVRMPNWKRPGVDHNRPIKTSDVAAIEYFGR